MKGVTLEIVYSIILNVAFWTERMKNRPACLHHLKVELVWN